MAYMAFFGNCRGYTVVETPIFQTVVFYLIRSARVIRTQHRDNTFGMTVDWNSNSAPLQDQQAIATDPEKALKNMECRNSSE